MVKVIDGVEFNEPEIVKGYGTDWKLYIPAGGWDWQANFYKVWVPAIDKLIAAMEAEKAKYVSAQIDLAEVQRGAKRAKEFFAAMKSLTTRYESLGDLFKSDPFMADWLGRADTMSRVLNDVLDKFRIPKDEGGKYDNELAYLKAFKAYIVQDLELDMTMWAMHSVDRKYRTKIFRAVCRKVKEINEYRKIVEGSQSDSAKQFGEKFAQTIAELHTGYETTTQAMKMQKKMMDAVGESFWNSDPVVSNEIRRGVHNGASNWQIVA